MMKLLIAVISCTVGLVASAAGVYVGDYEVVTNHVPAGGTSVVDGSVSVSPLGELKKTGGGSLEIQSSRVAQHWPMAISVVNGSAKISTEASDANPIPQALGKAALWVSAKDSGHVIKNGDQVLTWFDVREEDVQAPRYLRAVANNEKTTDCPTYMTKDGFACLYFGGVGSGQSMTFKNGADAVTKIETYHLFGVVGYYATQGFVFGAGGTGGTSEIPFYHHFSKGGVNRPYADGSVRWSWLARATVHVDGERCDPYVDIPPSGRFILFDAGSFVSRPNEKYTTGLFNMFSDKQYWGGDYLAEAVIFTNRLSETERVQVAAYLSKKWFGGPSTVKANVGKRGAYEIGDNSVEMTGVAFLPGGNGTVVKTGDKKFRYREPDALNSATAAFSGSIDLQKGGLELSSRLPLKVASGSRIETSVADSGDLRVSVEKAPAGELIKSGTGGVVVASLPSDVTRITVKSGKLDVLSDVETRLQAEEDDEVYIENPSFEAYANDSSLVADGGGLSLYAPGGNVYQYWHGWRRQTNAGRVFNWDLWTGRSEVWGATRADFGFDHRPLDGSCAVGLFQNTLLAAPVSIPRAGTYELSFDISAREHENHLGYYVTCTIWDKVKEVDVATFGKASFQELNYHRTALRADVSEAGDYELRIRAQNLNGNKCVVVDNFHLRRVTNLETGRYDVPNGDFEAGDLAFESEAKKKIFDSPFDNWTFNQGEGSVCLATLSVTDPANPVANSEYNGTRNQYGGFRQLILNGGTCSVEAACRPPAGTYYLRADVGKYFHYYGKLSATVSVDDGEPISLGTLRVTNWVMKSRTWDGAFSTDGTKTVRLIFTFERDENATSTETGVCLDDVRLVSFDDREFLANGGFEDTEAGNWAVGWTRSSAAVSSADVYPVTWQPYYYNGDALNGSHYLYIERAGGAEQDVRFDHAGRYRLSFYVASSTSAYHPDRGWYKRFSPVCAWLARGAVTNVIGVTEDVRTTNFCQHVWSFDVPSPGVYRFGIRGTDVSLNGVANACVDALSIRRVDTQQLVETAPTFSEDTVIRIENGARMRLSFEGKRQIRRLVLGGKSYSRCEIDISDYPEYFEGCGKFELVPNIGFSLIIR